MPRFRVETRSMDHLLDVREVDATSALRALELLSPAGASSIGQVILRSDAAELHAPLLDRFYYATRV